MGFESLNRSLRRTVAVLALVGACSAAFAWPASVDHVADGDTLTVLNKKTGERVRVRVASIDAPEIQHGPNRPGQPYGPEATKAMQRFVSRGTLDIRPTGSRSWDRIVAYVSVDGRDAGRELVASGLAWREPRYDRDGRYSEPQQKARAQRRGLWRQSNPIAPWQWRANRW
jgi:endonuclease YncB( thermonuclease family)